MNRKRIKGNRVKVKDAYLCKKLQLKIVQKVRFCGEDAPDLCNNCLFRDPYLPNYSIGQTKNDVSD